MQLLWPIQNYVQGKIRQGLETGLHLLALLLYVGCCAKPAGAQPTPTPTWPTHMPWVQAGEVLVDRGPFSRADSLLGCWNPERAYRVQHYELDFFPQPDTNFLVGKARFTIVALDTLDTLQIELAADSLAFNLGTGTGDAVLQTQHVGGRSWRMPLNRTLAPGETYRFELLYAGSPQVAEQPPWDGGFVRAQDEQGNPWLAVACEGDAASIWRPLRDLPDLEPDTVTIGLITPDSLMGVANGRLTGVDTLKLAETNTRNLLWRWRVSYPLNHYNLTFYVGDYGRFHRRIAHGADSLDLDFYFLKPHLKQAKRHFLQLDTILGFYQEYFGPYPYPADGYGLVEAPYWGMEHQGAIAYGNEFRNNSYGFDFILLHETGHEWFGNALSCADHADLWIHEALTTYTEALYVEHTRGWSQSLMYLMGQRGLIENSETIQGPRGVRFSDFATADMYYKGSWMLHSLRWWVNNDSLWFATLKQLYRSHINQQIYTEDVVAFFAERLGLPLQPFFAQYLTYRQPPQLQYKLKRTGAAWELQYRWRTDVADFSMPVAFELGETLHRLEAGNAWRTVVLEADPRQEAPVPHELRYYARHKRLDFSQATPKD